MPPSRNDVRGKAGESTRTMQASRMVTAVAILVVMGLTIFLYSKNMKAVMSFGLPGVMIIGGLFLFGMKSLEKKGKSVHKAAKRAERGAVAEEKTGELLEGLPEGNFVIHDYDTGRGNIDHIVIGTKGVFTVEVKSHRGIVTFENGKLLRDGKDFEKDFLKQAWAECFVVRERLAKWDIKEPAAEPLVVFSNAFVKFSGKAKGVEVMNLKSLPKYLEQQPDRLTKVGAGQIFNRLNLVVERVN